MAEETENVVLRLLREIRSTQTDDHRRLIKVEREMGEMKESMSATLGMSAHSVVVVGQQGDRFDEITDEIEALKRRVAELERQE